MATPGGGHQGHQGLGCRPATWELGVGVEGRRLSGEVYQLWSRKFCVRSRALEAVQAWRRVETRQFSEVYLSVTKVCLLGILLFFS